MKDLVQYICEAQKPALNQYERDAVSNLLGIATGNLGEDDDIKAYEPFMKDLSEEEKGMLNDIYDFLSNGEVYKRVRKSQLDKDELAVLKKFFDWCIENIDEVDSDFEDGAEKLS